METIGLAILTVGMAAVYRWKPFALISDEAYMGFGITVSFIATLVSALLTHL